MIADMLTEKHARIIEERRAGVPVREMAGRHDLTLRQLYRILHRANLVHAGLRRPPRSRHGPCLHCRAWAGHPIRRRLCEGCYGDPAIRRLYPSERTYQPVANPRSPAERAACRGVGNISGGHALATEPTDAAPGSPEKMAVLEERARLGVRLWHPKDRREA